MNTDTKLSNSLIGGLTNAALYPHPCDPIDVIETHISWVILTGPYAYKIKKPVDLGFVNFTTLDRRHYFCRQELWLNRRLAPELYKAVVPITGSPQEPRINGAGSPIEYAVKMRQFNQDELLDSRIRSDRISVDMIEQLADEIARFHKEVEVVSLTSPYGRADEILDAAADNFSAIQPYVDQRLRNAVKRLDAWTQYRFAQLRVEFEKRRRCGMVRECHGDMHLGNMFVERGVPTIFDCIEFNDSLRHIDIMSEVAFTVMDLVSHGRPDLAYRFLNRWLECTGDYAGLKVLRFYLTYRAMVRAKVACIREHEGGLAPAEADQLHRDFESYLNLGVRFVEAQSPKLIITHGFSGSGKTTGTNRLVEGGAIRVRSDIERKRLYKLGEGGCINPDLYTSEDTERTYN
ncbi:MAG: AAA family ATPase, partial [Planctomycetaceae bacterium]